MNIDFFHLDLEPAKNFCWNFSQLNGDLPYQSKSDFVACCSFLSLALLYVHIRVEIQRLFVCSFAFTHLTLPESASIEINVADAHVK